MTLEVVGSMQRVLPLIHQTKFITTTIVSNILTFL